MSTLKLSNVSVHKKAKTLLDRVSLNWHSGQVNGIIGPNGAGKSTLLKTVAKLQSYEGHIDYSGLEKHNRPSIAYVPQLAKTNSALSVYEMVLLGRVKNLYWRVTKPHLEAVDRALHQLGVTAISQQPFYTLSGGQRQMVLLAQAFVSEPQLLLLDEPTSALDLHHQLAVLTIVAEQTQKHDIMTLMVIHDLGLALRFCDELTLMHQGRVMNHESTATIGHSPQLAQAFEVGIEIGISAGGYPYLVPTEIRARVHSQNGGHDDQTARI